MRVERPHAPAVRDDHAEAPARAETDPDDAAGRRRAHRHAGRSRQVDPGVEAGAPRPVEPAQGCRERPGEPWQKRAALETHRGNRRRSGDPVWDEAGPPLETLDRARQMSAEDAVEDPRRKTPPRELELELGDVGAGLALLEHARAERSRRHHPQRSRAEGGGRDVVGVREAANGSRRGAAPDAVDRPVVPPLAVERDLERRHPRIPLRAGRRRRNHRNHGRNGKEPKQCADRRRGPCGVCAFHPPSGFLGRRPPPPRRVACRLTSYRGSCWMTYEDAISRLIEMAKESGGTVTAAQVEADPVLAEDELTVSAAARALGVCTNVFSSDEPDGRAWFPFSSLLFTEIQAPARR